MGGAGRKGGAKRCALHATVLSREHKGVDEDGTQAAEKKSSGDWNSPLRKKQKLKKTDNRQKEKKTQDTTMRKRADAQQKESIHNYYWCDSGQLIRTGRRDSETFVGSKRKPCCLADAGTSSATARGTPSTVACNNSSLRRANQSIHREGAERKEKALSHRYLEQFLCCSVPACDDKQGQERLGTVCACMCMRANVCAIVSLSRR